MRQTSSIRSRRHTLRSAFGGLFLFALIAPAFAQEPPLEVARNSPPGRTPDAVTIGEWLLSPTVRAYTLYSDNLFQSPQNRLSVLGFGTSPSLTAERSDGIHTTKLYGNIDRGVFPTENELNTFNRQAGFNQKYEALRDLTFSVQGDYNHQTNASTLRNSIPTAVVAPGTTVLPNGDTVLPNGTILSPTGQPVGQVNSTNAINGAFSVNPNNQFIGTFSVGKTFNRGILSLTSSLSRTDYENQGSQNSKTRSFTESAGFWLGPLFYAYSNGAIATFENDAPSSSSSSTTSHRVVGGIGTRQLGLFKSSLYFGHQGSQGGSTASGDVYGGTLIYYPTPAWTLTGTVDETINISSQASLTNLALTLPGLTPVQIPLGASTRITATALLSEYQIARQWLTSWQFGYTRIEYIDSPRLDNTLLLDATLGYDMSRNIALKWEYKYTRILSNAPLVSTSSNLGTMSAIYKF